MCVYVCVCVRTRILWCACVQVCCSVTDKIMYVMALEFILGINSHQTRALTEFEKNETETIIRVINVPNFFPLLSHFCGMK